MSMMPHHCSAECRFLLARLLLVAVCSIGMPLIAHGQTNHFEIIGKTTVVQSPPTAITDLKVAGHHAYAVSAKGLTIFNLAQSATPVLEGSCETSGTARRLTLSGDRAYIPAGTQDLHIIDVSQPSKTQILGIVKVSAADVAVEGTMAYVANSNPGLQIIDVADPAAPILRGSYSTFVEYTLWSDGPVKTFTDKCPATGVAIAGTQAYLIGSGLWPTNRLGEPFSCPFGLQVIDISDPDHPVLARKFHNNVGTSASRLILSGQRAYVTGKDSITPWYQSIYGMSIFDLNSGLDYPLPLGSFTVVGEPFEGSMDDLCVAGDLAYVLTDKDLQILDLRNPRQPVLRDTFTTNAAPTAIELMDDLIILGDAQGDISILRYTNPFSISSSSKPCWPMYE